MVIKACTRVLKAEKNVTGNSNIDRVFFQIHFRIALTMMIAKCFARGCSSKAAQELKGAETQMDMKKWRPCMGCRSHWIHIKCGGFCSECQPSSNDAIAGGSTQ
jgi:hypothetical protein